MTYQTHPLFGELGVGSDDCAAPRAHDVVIARRFFDTSSLLFRQHDLLCSYLKTNPVPVISVLT